MSNEIVNGAAAIRKHRHFSAMRRNEAIAGYLFMLPLLLGIVFLTYGQFIYSLIISFTDQSVFGARNKGKKNLVGIINSDAGIVGAVHVHAAKSQPYLVVFVSLKHPLERIS